ncbi:MAG: membrane protein insertion efficiency factor YidD [Cytophagales bacterium]
MITLLNKLFVGFGIVLVKIYQLTISPFFPNACRFHPTCSSYMIEALKTHGFIKGSWLGLKRISKCHPWGESGFDPVPECEQKSKKKQQD